MIKVMHSGKFRGDDVRDMRMSDMFDMHLVTSAAGPDPVHAYCCLSRQGKKNQVKMMLRGCMQNMLACDHFEPESPLCMWQTADVSNNLRWLCRAYVPV